MEIDEIKAGLDDIASAIRGASQAREHAKNTLLQRQQQLAAIPADYAELRATIQGYAPTGAFETLSKDELAKLESRFTALKAGIEAELTALGIPF
jgi:chromosome segregation ATPase